MEYWSIGVLEYWKKTERQWRKVGSRKIGCLKDPLLHSSNIPWFRGWNPIDLNERRDMKS
jgi:hypothetical protein